MVVQLLDETGFPIQESMLVFIEQVLFFKKVNKVVSDKFFKELDQMRRQRN